MYMQSTCSEHGPFFPEHQGDPCPICKADRKFLFDFVKQLERMLYHGQFVEVDALIRTMPNHTSTPPILIGTLSLTYYAKPYLKERDAFLARAEAKLKADLGDERAESLLKNRR